jgi:menaquinone-dependent protoporphyrinogen IX oxidase
VSVDGKTKVLFVYYSFTQNTRRVADTMARTLRGLGYDVTEAAIEFTDPHYGPRFSKLPMSWPVAKITGMLPAQLRRKTGRIVVPPEAASGGYDLVVIGSPTWWLTTCMPIRSYLHDPAAGRALSGTPFAAFHDLASLLQAEPRDDPRAGHETRRDVCRRHPLRVRWKPGDVHVVVARVHAAQRRAATLSRRPDAEAQPPQLLRGAGDELHRGGGQQGARVTRDRREVMLG